MYRFLFLFVLHGRCLFSGLALGPSMATLALAANWNYFEISFTGAACALLSAALSAFSLRDVPHASGTWEKGSHFSSTNPKSENIWHQSKFHTSHSFCLPVRTLKPWKRRDPIRLDPTQSLHTPWFWKGVARTGNDAELWELHEQVALCSRLLRFSRAGLGVGEGFGIRLVCFKCVFWVGVEMSWSWITGSCRWKCFCWCWKKWNGEAWGCEARFV